MKGKPFVGKYKYLKIHILSAVIIKLNRENRRKFSGKHTVIVLLFLLIVGNVLFLFYRHNTLLTIIYFIWQDKWN